MAAVIVCLSTQAQAQEINRESVWNGNSNGHREEPARRGPHRGGSAWRSACASSVLSNRAARFRSLRSSDGTPWRRPP